MFADRAKIYIPFRQGRRRTLQFQKRTLCTEQRTRRRDGGRGGDLIFAIDEGLNTLVDYRHKRKYAAGDGEPGGKTAMPRKRQERSYPLCSGGNSDQKKL